MDELLKEYDALVLEIEATAEAIVRLQLKSERKHKKMERLYNDVANLQKRIKEKAAPPPCRAAC